MNDGHLSNRRRYLAVWFPWLPADRTQRTRREGSPEDAPPVVFVEKVGGALRLAAVDPAAARLDLRPGLPLADARARTPLLRTLPHRPDRDEALLARVLEDFDRFSPRIALDPPHGLVLDVTGCAHLFGGEEGLRRAVQARARRLGLDARLALAGTPQAARALARHDLGGGPGGALAEAAARAALRRLPVCALELDPREAQALRRAGLKTLGDLDDRPRAPLAARFGAGFPARLARVLGDEDIRITPHRPPAPVTVDRVFFEPVSTDGDVRGGLADLLAEAALRLEARTLGARLFEAAFYRVDGETRRVAVRTGCATRDAEAVERLFVERLAALATPLDPGFGFDQIRLTALETSPLAAAQPGLEGGVQRTEAGVQALIDRLTARLGPEAVLIFQSYGSHIPERAARLAAAGAEGNGQDAWPERDPDDPPLRPLQMFHPPQPVETLAEAPDGRPFRFRWRRVMHDVVRAEGPERIAGEWWRAPDQRTRDYYRVEDAHGRRFWLFRQGLYGEAEPPRWFIHGLFA